MKHLHPITQSINSRFVGSGALTSRVVRNQSINVGFTGAGISVCRLAQPVAQNINTSFIGNGSFVHPSPFIWFLLWNTYYL